LLTYIFGGPLLGVVLTLKLGRKFARNGGLSEHIMGAVMGSALIAALFTPASMGTEGFGWVIPLPVVYFFPQHTYTFPWMIPVTFAVAFLLIRNAAKTKREA
jgi:hypothetical protein